jgi:hypothetical protein
MEIILKLPNWLRWILLPFASILTLIIINFLGKIATKIIIFLTTQGWSENFFEFLLIPGISGYCAVYIAMVIAPNNKKIVGYSIAFFWIAMAGALAVLNFMLKEWPSVLQSITIIAGCIIAIYDPLQDEITYK